MSNPWELRQAHSVAGQARVRRRLNFRIRGWDFHRGAAPFRMPTAVRHIRQRRVFLRASGHSHPMNARYWLFFPADFARTSIRSPCPPKTLSTSAGWSPVLPNQCGTWVSNSATSPGPKIRS